MKAAHQGSPGLALTPFNSDSTSGPLLLPLGDSSALVDLIAEQKLLTIESVTPFFSAFSLSVMYSINDKILIIVLFIYL